MKTTPSPRSPSILLAGLIGLSGALGACGGPDEEVGHTVDALSGTGNTMQVHIDLETIFVHDEGDGSGPAEPYLWPIFFKVDSTTLLNLDNDPLDPANPAWLIAPNGNHGNLGGQVGAGATIQIPSALGEVTLDLYPGLVPKNQAFVGAIVVLMEEDDFPSSSEMTGYYRDFADQVVQGVRHTMLCELTASQLQIFGYTRPTDCAIAGSSGSSIPLDERIAQQLQESFSGPAHIDDVIGVEYYEWSWDDLVTAPSARFNKRWNQSTGSEDGDFEVFGRLATDAQPGTCSGAPLLIPGESIPATIGRPGDIDYYKVQLARPGHFAAHTTSNGTDTFGALLNANCQQIAADDDSGAVNNFSFSRPLDAGTYYVSVREYAAASIGDYTLHTTVANDNHADTTNGATQAAIGSGGSGRIDPASDLDFFEIQLSAGGTLTVYTSGGLDTFGRLYGAGTAGQIASDDDSGDGSNFSITRNLSAGTYYVSVASYAGSFTGDYRLHVQWFASDDHGNSCRGATPIATIANVPSSIESAGDVDYFRVIFGTQSNLRVYSSSNMDTYGTILNRDCQPIAQDDDSGVGQNFLINRTVLPGTYYIAVRNYSANVTGNYTLVVNPFN